jgi:LITAF-like zinc ribbon domain
MKQEDFTRFQHAVALANSGKHQMAYEEFSAIYNHGNSDDVNLLCWIASMTPYREEVQWVINNITRIDPEHPKIQEVQDFLKRNWERFEHPPIEAYSSTLRGPILQCPYCHTTGPTRVKSRVSIAGWIWFAVFFLLFLCFMLALVPAYEVNAMERAAYGSLFIGFFGFLFRKQFRICSYCQTAIGNIG